LIGCLHKGVFNLRIVHRLRALTRHG
jgi:hypothetical protein